MAADVVRIEGLCLHRAGTAVLSDLDLQVGASERLAILGPSGCGKTSLLRLIAGFIAPDRGTIHLWGRLVSDGGRVVVPPEKRDIGFVFQDLALWPHMTVAGNLEFGLKARSVPRDERRRRVSEMLEMTSLSGLEGRRPGELSGGQQQRVALARALVLRPRLVLMDEPLSNLHWELRQSLIQEILELQSRFSFTIIYVTHDREEAWQMAQRIMLLEQGRLEPADQSGMMPR